ASAGGGRLRVDPGLGRRGIPGLGGRLLWLHARRALALAGKGMGLAASWWALTVALPFLWLLALVGLTWLAGRSHPSGGVASGNRSSSSPSE
ncbi:hypothetical protein LR090_03580, partial [Candidatus Bipolaricaulota bacterium]|nr:hypothetical protein [Candidatus Bipolaricaulota bacterium]